MRPTWDEYYLGIAKEVAKRSSCIKRKVGAVIVVDNRVVSTGYNGTPRHLTNCNEGGCPRCAATDIPSGEKLDTCLCSHAEENAIVSAAYGGTAIKGGHLYTTFSPCIWCAKMVINGGIVSVKFAANYSQASGTLLAAAKIDMLYIGNYESTD